MTCACSFALPRTAGDPARGLALLDKQGAHFAG